MEVRTYKEARTVLYGVSESAYMCSWLQACARVLAIKRTGGRKRRCSSLSRPRCHRGCCDKRTHMRRAWQPTIKGGPHRSASRADWRRDFFSYDSVSQQRQGGPNDARAHRLRHSPARHSRRKPRASRICGGTSPRWRNGALYISQWTPRCRERHRHRPQADHNRPARLQHGQMHGRARVS